MQTETDKYTNAVAEGVAEQPTGSGSFPTMLVSRVCEYDEQYWKGLLDKRWCR